MPIDYARYPDIPPGAKLQPTADPETAYVLADDAATGKRTSIGMIRHGVFTPAPQYALVAAQAEFSKAAEEPPPAPASTPALELPDVFGKAETDAWTTAQSTPAVPASVFLTSVFFAVLTGGTNPADAARFYRQHTGFTAALAGTVPDALPSLSEEAFRRFLAVLSPQATSQYLQQSLFTALSRYLKHAVTPTTDVTFDAAAAALSVGTMGDKLPSLPVGFAYANAVVTADGSPAVKPFFKAALEAGCDWVAPLNPDDAASAALIASVEKTLTEAASLTHNTDRGVFRGAAGARLPKSIQKALPGLGVGLVFSRKTAEGTTLFASSLPAVRPGLQRAATVVCETPDSSLTVYFPTAVTGNAAVILNLAVITKITKAVRKNEERRRAIAGLPAWTPAEAHEFFTDPAGAAQSTAAFLTVV